jgi:two-component system response regulator DesR
MTARGKLTVLVVDDHDIVHWGMRIVLVQQDWVQRCIPATTGDEAEDRARRYTPHVALVDLFVGDEAGTDIARRVRAAHPATRVLLVSGAGRISATAARAAGAAGPAAQLLTTRERQVLEFVAGGLTNAEIAAELELSPNTVKEHASSMFRKLGARNRADAVQRAQRLGVLA